MSCLKNLCRSAWLVLATLVCSQAMAGVVITGTRLIYPAGQKEITVKLNNNGLHPALVQAWVDTGDVQSSPTSSKARLCCRRRSRGSTRVRARACA